MTRAFVRGARYLQNVPLTPFCSPTDPVERTLRVAGGAS